MVGLHGVLIGFSYSLTGFVTYGCYFASYGQFQVFESTELLSATALTYQSGASRSQCN
jgi:succinate-acetate transporter protein